MNSLQNSLHQDKALQVSDVSLPRFFLTFSDSSAVKDFGSFDIWNFTNLGLGATVIGIGLLTLVALALIDLATHTFKVADLSYKLHFLDYQEEVSLSQRIHNMKYDCPEVFGSEIIKMDFYKSGLAKKLLKIASLSSIKEFCAVTNAIAELYYKVKGEKRLDDTLQRKPKGIFSHTRTQSFERLRRGYHKYRPYKPDYINNTYLI